MYPTDSRPPSLIETFAVVRRRWLAVVLLTVLVTVLSVGFAVVNERRADPVFQAKHLLTLNLERGQGGTGTLEQLALLLTEGTLSEEASGQSAGAELVDIEATVDAERQLLTISGKGPEPGAVAEATNSAAHALVDYLGDRDLEAFQDQIDEMQERLDISAARVGDLQLRVAADPLNPQLAAERDSAVNEYRAALDGLRSIQATGPPEPLLGSIADGQASRLPIGGFTGLPHYQHAVLGLVLGLLLGLGLAYMLDALDHRLASAESASRAFDLPVLAEVPDGGRVFRTGDALAPNGSAINEAYRRLRTALTLDRQATTGKATIVVLVVSPGPGEGKTTTVAHLARALGEVGQQVLAVSADFRRPRLHRLFGVPAAEGLAGLGEDSRTVAAEQLLQRTQVPGVQLITAGPGTSDPTELIRNTRRLISASRGHFDFVVVDTSPLLSANDTLDLVDVADRVVIVARHRHTNRSAAERVRDMLGQAMAPTLGVVLTGVRGDERYGYYYGYEPSRPGP